MSTIQDATTLNLFAPYGTKNTAKPAADDLQDRFLKLLVTQMKNQDPLNPLDNAQVTSQLAQISTVNGIEKLNATIEAMASSFNFRTISTGSHHDWKRCACTRFDLQLAGGSEYLASSWRRLRIKSKCRFMMPPAK